MSLDALKYFKKGTVEWYAQAFNLCEPDADRVASVNSAVMTVLKGKDRYIGIANYFGFTNPEFYTEGGVPYVPFWAVIGTIHYKECSCDFKGVLHNGERIVGTGQKTSIVPIGRGPFATWEIAAKDAIQHDGLQHSKLDIGSVLKSQEEFNGTGYLKYHPEENSPYLWASSNINDGRGKYVSDGKYDWNADTNKTVGAGMILKELFNRSQLPAFPGDAVTRQVALDKNRISNLQTAINLIIQPDIKVDGYVSDGGETQAALRNIADAIK